MKYILYILLLGTALFAATPNAREKLFVVEGESESISIISKRFLKSCTKNMHNMNHDINNYGGKNKILMPKALYS